MKLRPVDFASEGMFLCGLAHSPRLIEESIAQSQAAAGRAATILAKDHLDVGGVVSVIDGNKCVITYFEPIVIPTFFPGHLN
ncbi:MAG: hypothetical protein AB1422_04050 [bacterium]